MTVTKEMMRDALRKAGIAGLPVGVHASYRSFGKVEGGPSAIVEALLEEGNTVLAPTFSNSFRVPPPKDRRPRRNGIQYDRMTHDEHDRVYDPSSETIDLDTMGAVPAVLVRMPGRLRGNHPCHSFSAVGPLAGELISAQAPMNVYGPLSALAELGGVVILMGVGYDRLTLLHLAEQRAGRRLFIRWANDGRGGKMECEVGGCSLGFHRFAPVLDPLVRRVSVGPSVWTVCPAREVLHAAAAAIRSDPAITHCGDPDCERCNDMLRGGPIPL